MSENLNDLKPLTENIKIHFLIKGDNQFFIQNEAIPRTFDISTVGQ